MKISKFLKIEVMRGDVEADHVFITELLEEGGEVFVTIEPNEYIPLARALEKAHLKWSAADARVSAEK